MLSLQWAITPGDRERQDRAKMMSVSMPLMVEFPKVSVSSPTILFYSTEKQTYNAVYKKQP